MKFMMIFEGVDRATKVMSKIMAAEKKTAAVVKAGAKASEAASRGAVRASEKQASALAKIGNAARSGFNATVAGAKAAGGAIATLHRQTIALGKAGLNQIGAGFGKVFRGIGLAAGVAATALGAAALAAGKLVGIASQFEKFQTILETTEGSSAKAKTAMAWVTDFAAKTPYELDQVMDSFVQLRTLGLDPTNGLLKALGDTSSAMGKPLMQGVEAMADAVTGENERLKAFGITASKTGNKIAYMYTNSAGKQMKASVAANDRMAIQAKLMEIFSEKYGGAMGKLSQTWDGMTSNLSDVWTQFQLAIMNAGLFDWMKGKLQGVLDTINEMKANGTLDIWAKQISDRIVMVLETAWQFATRTWEILKTLGTYLKMGADYVGGWENLAMVLAAIAVAPMLVSTAAGLVQIAIGMSMLATAIAGLSITGPLLAIGAGFAKLGVALKVMGAVLMANPIMLIIAAIVAGAIAIYVYWEPIKAFFIGLWDAIAAGAQAAWNKLKEWIGFDPIAALSAGWQSLTAFFSGWWASLPSLDWNGLIPAFSWSNVLTVLSWASWLSPIRWLDYLPTVDWSAVVPDFKWPTLPDWKGVSIAADLDAVVASATAIWDRLKAVFDWSPAEAIRAAWADIAGLVGDLVGGVVSSAAGAWEGMKSVFTFGEAAAPSLEMSDPATIRATAAATAALKADLQSVAAVDTGPAMAKLAALDAAAARVKQSVVSSITQAQAFLGNISFFNQGAALMDTMAAGIRSRAAVVIAEIQKMAQAIRDHLPSSPAKVGPLSDIHRLKFGETIAGSIRAAPMVKAMRIAAAATMSAAAISMPAVAVPALASASALPSADAARAQVARASLQSGGAPGGGLTVHFNPTITLSGNGGGNPADIKAAVQEALRESARELAKILEGENHRKSRREF